MVFDPATFAFIEGLGAPEMLLIFVIILVLFGGQKLPEFARGLGKSIREFKKAAAGVEEEFKRALEEDDRKKSLPSTYPSTPEAALPAPETVPQDEAADPYQTDPDRPTSHPESSYQTETPPVEESPVPAAEASPLLVEGTPLVAAESPPLAEAEAPAEAATPPVADVSPPAADALPAGTRPPPPPPPPATPLAESLPPPKPPAPGSAESSFQI